MPAYGAPLLSLFCDELKWDVKVHLSPAVHKPRKEAPFCAADDIWMSLGLKKHNVFCGSHCAFLVQGWFSPVQSAVCMFWLLNLFIVNIQLRKRSRLQTTLGCLNKKTNCSLLPQGDGNYVSSQLVFTFHVNEFTFRSFLRELFGILA